MAINVDIMSYLEDCPPGDIPISQEMMPEIVGAVESAFDYSEIYEQIDRLACAILRDKGLLPETTPSPYEFS